MGSRVWRRRHAPRGDREQPELLEWDGPRWLRGGADRHGERSDRDRGARRGARRGLPVGLLRCRLRRRGWWLRGSDPLREDPRRAGHEGGDRKIVGREARGDRHGCDDNTSHAQADEQREHGEPSPAPRLITQQRRRTLKRHAQRHIAEPGRVFIANEPGNEPGRRAESQHRGLLGVVAGRELLLKAPRTFFCPAAAPVEFAPMDFPATVGDTGDAPRPALRSSATCPSALTSMCFATPR